MIKKEEIIEIGKFQKTHALKGELNALLDVDPDFASEGNPLIVEADGIFVPFFAESVRPKGSEACLIKLHDIDSQEAARLLVNKIIYARREDIKNHFGEDFEGDMLADELIGYRVIDAEAGDIGEVVDIEDSTSNELLIVETPEGKTVYVPIADEIINEIDDDAAEILVTLPEGLLDLNG